MLVFSKKYHLKALTLVAITVLASGCGSSSEDTPKIDIPIGEAKAETLLDMSQVAIDDQPALAKDWHKGAVFMEIFVRSYKDSDGDGIGDFEGLTSQLDYIAELGVEGIWLMPFSESSDKDHGYEVVDYRSIESDYGTREDFDEFLKQAHARGIGVIADYVINHSSGDNPVFILSLIHSDVMEFHYDNLRYWLNAGIDGFRFDAVGQLVENGPDQTTGQPENTAILYGLQQVVTQGYSHRYMICEDPTSSASVVNAAGDDSCGSSFSFYLNDSIMSAVQQGYAGSDFTDKLTSYPLDKMGIVLANHDLFSGHRIYEQVGGDEAKYRLAATTLLTLPGQPFVYYGEEVGMGHTKHSSGDYLLRAPMSWTHEGGFTTGTPYREIATNTENYNVTSQMADNSSIYHHYKKLIQLRKATQALRSGDLTVLHEGEVLAYRRSISASNVLVVLNYSDSAQDASIPLEVSSAVLSPLAGFGSGNVSRTSDGSLALQLAANEIRIYQY